MNDRLDSSTPFLDFFGGTGDVAPVNPDDLRKVWAMMHELRAHAPVGHSIDCRVYESACTPGADVMAVWYRASMLGLLQMLPVLPEKPLTPWTHDGELDDSVFQVAATFPMQKLQVGVVRNGPPFDVKEFLRLIGERSWDHQ